jgi:hypothetical protein
MGNINKYFLFDETVEKTWNKDCKKEDKWFFIGYPLSIGITPLEPSRDSLKYFYLSCNYNDETWIWCTKKIETFKKFCYLMESVSQNYTIPDGAPNECLKYSVDLTRTNDIDKWVFN